MAQPLLDFLVGRAKEALPYLSGAARQGLTAAAAIDLLKPLNLTFNRQRMLDVYAALQNRKDPERSARLVGENVPIPQELHRESPADLSTNYQYVVGAYDENGDNLGHVTVVSSVPLAAAAIRENALDIFRSDTALYLSVKNAAINSVSIVEANVSVSAPKA